MFCEQLNLAALGLTIYDADSSELTSPRALGGTLKFRLLREKARLNRISRALGVKHMEVLGITPPFICGRPPPRKVFAVL